MGNQTSCCAQNKEITPSEFHFNAPIDGLHKQFPDTTTNQDDSTNPSSALRKGIHTDYSMTKTQQDLSDNIRDQDPKKKKKLMRKKPPPLTDLGSLQDCTSVAQGPVQAQSPKYFENENGNENCEAIERKRACWEIDEDKNLSIRLSERRPVLQERTANLNRVENDGIESVRKDEARGIQSRKDVIEAGIIAQKYGEEDIDDEFDNEDDYDVMPKKEDAVGYQPNAYPGALANIEKQYRSTQGEKLTEVFETPREEIEEISDSVNYGYGNDGEKTFTIPQDSAAQSYREAGAKSNRSAQDRLVYAYTQHVGNQTNQQNTVYYTQEEEVQKTVSTLYEDAFSCSMYMGKKIHEFNERTLQDGAFGNESARSMNKKESRPKEDPLSARKQREYQDQNNKSPVREDEAKLLSGLYQTCQSVVPAEAFEASPICKGDRENQMRSSFCGEDRKLFVSEIIKNIQMKNVYNKDKGTPQRENSWLARAERETGNIDASKRESVQKEVQKLVDSAFKPRNNLLENILRQSKESNKSLENFVVKRDDWREELNKKTQYSHPFSNNEYTIKDAILQRPQQEQMREYQNYGLDTPGFKNEGLLNKSWEKYSVQERKDMLLTKRFMHIPVDGADN